MKILKITFLFVLVSFAAKAQLTSGNAIVQGENITNPTTNYTRAVFSHNATWDDVQKRWVMNIIGANDAQAILIPNNGGFDFIIHESTGNFARTMSHGDFVGGKVMSILRNGDVGISKGNLLIGKDSQVNNTYRLDVDGKVRVNEVVVNTTGADFVFANNYRLRPLSEVEAFIKRHQHLPEIAPAAEMQKNGVGLSKLSTQLLQKVEELTLYTIQLKKENEALKQQMKKYDALAKRLEQLEKAMKKNK
jgi:hypothetical protein